MYIDSHSHINYITHNVQSNVESTIVCAVKESDFVLLNNLVDKDEHIFPAFGIHPWYINSISDNWFDVLHNILIQNHKYMVGEIGLDKYKPDMDVQIDVFTKQLHLAFELNRPVFLHCVGAWDKILHIFKEYKQSLPQILIAHAFSGSEEILKVLVEEYGMYISFNNVDDKNHGLIKEIPLDRLLVETDAKDVDISVLVDKIKKITKCDNIGSIIYNNAKRVLNG